MNIIDFHTHAFPDAIAGKTIAHLEKVSGLTALGDGTVSALRAHMRKSGVALAVNLPVVTRPSQYQTVNDFAAALNREGDGIVSFGGIHPDSEAVEDELDGIVARGLRGIKLHPDYQDVMIDDPRYLRIVRGALLRDLHIVTHAGLDSVSPELVHAPPALSRRLIEALGDLPKKSRGRLIFAHLGGNERHEEVEKHLVGMPVMLDLSFILRRISKDRLLRIIRAHGTDNILFGSDYPWSDPAADAEVLMELGLGEGELADIFENNARALLN